MGRRWRVVAVLVAAVSGACSGGGAPTVDGGVPPTLAPPSDFDGTPVVVADGPTATIVALGGGARLVIPPGAITPGATVQVRYEAPPVGDWGTLDPLAAPVELSTDADTIHAPLTLEFHVPAPPAGAPAAAVGVSTFDEATRTWTAVPSTYDPTRQMVVAPIRRLSWWGPYRQDWAEEARHANLRAEQILTGRPAAPACWRAQPVPAWVVSTAGITEDAGLGVRACAEGEGDVLAVEVVNDRPYGVYVGYQTEVAWAWHEEGGSERDRARNELGDRLAQPGRLYLPPRGRGSIGITRTAGYHAFPIEADTASVAVDLLDVVLGASIDRIPRGGTCLPPLLATPLGSPSPERVAERAKELFGCVYEDAATAGYLDGSSLARLQAYERALSVDGVSLRLGSLVWKLGDLYLDWTPGASGLGAGFSLLGRPDETPTRPVVRRPRPVAVDPEADATETETATETATERETESAVPQPSPPATDPPPEPEPEGGGGEG